MSTDCTDSDQQDLRDLRPSERQLKAKQDRSGTRHPARGTWIQTQTSTDIFGALIPSSHTDTYI